jgi:hypothetical protein
MTELGVRKQTLFGDPFLFFRALTRLEKDLDAMGWGLLWQPG